MAARPWLVWQVGERLGWRAPEGFDGAAPKTPEEEGQEYGRACEFLWNELEKHFTLPEAIKRFRFHVRMTCGWLEFGQHLWSLVTKARTGEEIRAALQSFFAQPQRMSSRTHLRD